MSQPRRVLLDTNVLITFLLDRKRQSLATPIVEAALGNRYRVLVSDELFHELISRVQRKPYLARNITSADLSRLVTALSVAAERVNLAEVAIPRIVRDSNDDYLIAIARIGNADILVTGDHDLLDIADLTSFRIMSMRDFADLLDLSETSEAESNQL